MTKRPQRRSPSYPGTSLREAVDRVSEFYRRDGDDGAPAREAALHIGFRTKHGQALSALAALKKYGLAVVDDAKGLLLPTSLAREIVNRTFDDPRRAVALREAALRPRIYRELAQRYSQHEFPSNDVIQRELVTNRGFNPNAVRIFIRDFRDTLAFTGLLVDGIITLDSPAGFSQSREGEISPSDFRTEIASSSNSTRSNGEELPMRRFLFDVSVPRQLKAELALWGKDFRKEDLLRLKKQLERLIDNIADAIED